MIYQWYTFSSGFEAASGTAGTVNIHNIKESIRFILDQANTATSSSVDLSSGLDTRVRSIFKLNPEKIQPQPSLFPCVTVFCDRKEIEQKDINTSMVVGRRRAKVHIKIVGILWNDQVSNIRYDDADDDIEQLMENVEAVLRHYATLGNNCNWQLPEDVTYHSVQYDEQTHMRVGVLGLVASVFY